MAQAMEHNNGSVIGLVISMISWGFMQFFLKIGLQTFADYSSLCVILGVCWTIIANADRAITNIERFFNWIKSKLK